MFGRGKVGGGGGGGGESLGKPRGKEKFGFVVNNPFCSKL